MLATATIGISVVLAALDQESGDMPDYKYCVLDLVQPLYIRSIATQALTTSLRDLLNFIYFKGQFRYFFVFVT